MKPLTLKQVSELKLSEIVGHNFIVTYPQFKRLSKALDKIEGLFWSAGQKPSDHLSESHNPSAYRRYSISWSGMTSSIHHHLVDPTTITVTDLDNLKSYTIKELKSLSLSDLDGTYFRCRPSRYKRIGKALDCVEGLRWLTGVLPSEYGSETSIFSSGDNETLRYCIKYNQLVRTPDETDHISSALTRISIRS